jgi:hypothetical protein
MMRKTERVCLMYLPRFRGYRSEVKAKTRVARSVPTTLQTRLLLPTPDRAISTARHEPSLN